MLKITATRTNGHGTTVRLEGRLVGPWVSELRRFAEQSLDDPAGVRLDLAAVIWADRGGIALLRELGRRGATLHGAAEFIERQISEPEGEP